MFIVKPNYNHWNALNWPLIVLLGIGAMLIWENLNKQKLKLLLVGIPLMVFALFINSYYGGLNNKITILMMESKMIIPASDYKILNP